MLNAKRILPSISNLENRLNLLTNRTKEILASSAQSNKNVPLNKTIILGSSSSSNLSTYT